MRHGSVLKISRLIQIVFIRDKDIVFVPTSFPGGNSEREPPDPISNSEVKTLSADGSVGSPHVRVGHRQDFNSKKAVPFRERLFLCIEFREIMHE